MGLITIILSSITVLYLVIGLCMAMLIGVTLRDDPKLSKEILEGFYKFRYIGLFLVVLMWPLVFLSNNEKPTN